jgi:hypothetical protein
MAHNLTPFVVAMSIPLQRSSAKLVERLDCSVSPVPQPMYHAGQDVPGDVVPLHDPNRRGDPGGRLHMTNLAGVGKV